MPPGEGTTPLALYQQLRTTYGPQPNWWPSENAFEIALGAILTQNTRWQNAAKAIANLKQAGLTDSKTLLQTPPELIAAQLKPAGYYNLKTQRLLHLCRYLENLGGLSALAALPLATARAGLLLVKGIGPETADDILLYALQQPVFVIDLYTRRLLTRYGLATGDEPYDQLRTYMEQRLPTQATLYQEYHALIVCHAQRNCTKQPTCYQCALQTHCAQHGL
jgi:endonuclease-3 related protein